jgi:hypothetical protein
MNLLHYNYFKPPTYFSHLSWPSSGRFFYEGFIEKTIKGIVKYKILIFVCVIIPVYIKIRNTGKIIGAKCTWVGSVQVLCVLRHHPSKVVLLR